MAMCFSQPSGCGPDGFNSDSAMRRQAHRSTLPPLCPEREVEFDNCGAYYGVVALQKTCAVMSLADRKSRIPAWAFCAVSSQAAVCNWT